MSHQNKKKNYNLFRSNEISEEIQVTLETCQPFKKAELIWNQTVPGSLHEGKEPLKERYIHEI